MSQWGGTATRIGGISDHVHVLASLSPTVTVSKAVNLMKGISSRWVNDQWRGRGIFAWQEGYGAFSVSASQVARVTAYIERQGEHHRGLTFDDEFRVLLEKHEMPFDRLWQEE